MAATPFGAMADFARERPREDAEEAVADRAGCLLMLVSAGPLHDGALSDAELATLVQVTPMTWAHAAFAVACAGQGPVRGGDSFARLRAAHEVTRGARDRILYERSLAGRAARAALRTLRTTGGDCPWLAVCDREAAPREEPAGSPARRLDGHLGASCNPVLDVLAATHPSVERAVASAVPSFFPAHPPAPERSRSSGGTYQFCMGLERRVAARRHAAALAARVGRASAAPVPPATEGAAVDDELDRGLLRDATAAGAALWPADEVERVVGAALRVWLPAASTAGAPAAPGCFGDGESAWRKLSGLLAPSAPLVAAAATRDQARQWCLLSLPSAADWPTYALEHSLGAWLAAVAAATSTALRLRPMKLSLPVLCAWARDASALLAQLWGMRVPAVSREAAEAAAQALAALAQSPAGGEASRLCGLLSHLAHDGANAVQRACERAVWRVMWPLAAERARGEGLENRSMRASRPGRKRLSARVCGVRVCLWLHHPRPDAPEWEDERVASHLEAARDALRRGAAWSEAPVHAPPERVAWLTEAVVHAIPCSVLAAQRGSGSWTFERREKFAMCVPAPTREGRGARHRCHKPCLSVHGGPTLRGHRGGFRATRGSDRSLARILTPVTHPPPYARGADDVVAVCAFLLAREPWPSATHDLRVLECALDPEELRGEAGVALATLEAAIAKVDALCAEGGAGAVGGEGRAASPQ